MKKLLVLLLIVLPSLALAQQSHIKFMGIPVNGTINTFSAKLKAKGFTVDSYSQKMVGGRAFNGKFFGNKASVYVYYNTATKVVYRAKAVIPVSNKSAAENLFYELKASLKEKYPNAVYLGGETGADDDMTFYLSSGNIDLFIRSNDYEYINGYNVYVDYWDTVNSDANDSKLRDDL